ncbi:MAG: ABC transporter substrate-binding protein [Lachnospiraceae bacterium]|nr:ABC transporter substrate-binding protein [Lachnospiraceae bacterium]
MKKKALSLLLASTMVVSLAACGGNNDASNGSTSASSDNNSSTASSGSSENTESSGDSGSASSDYVLTDVKIMVNGTVNSVKQETEAQQTNRDAFIPQLEAAVGEAIGHEINIDFEVASHSDYAGYVGRMFVSGQIPDVMIMSADMLKQYEKTGLLWDMADAYANAEFQSRLQLPGINENLKDSQGHLYGFAPTYGNGCVTYIKQAWLDNLGINGDDIKTYDDFYNMLVRFSTEDPDGNGVDGDTYGFISAGLIGNEAPWINYVAEFWQGAYPSILQGDDGVWYDGFQTDEAKEALLRLQKAYKEGVIDPDSFTAGTKDAREKWFGAEQSGSAGVFTYWAGTWYQNLANNLEKNGVDNEVYELAPIAEITNTFGGYLNREAPVWVILDDGDGDDSREQAIFTAILDTMLDGDKVQTLWTYGPEGIAWSTEAEEFSLYPDDPDKRKDYSYQDGEFHMRPGLEDPNILAVKNHLDPALCISPLTNGFVSSTDLQDISNKFFTDNCVDAPSAPASDTYSERSAEIIDARDVVIAEVVVNGGDVDAAMQKYVSDVGSLVDQILEELNSAE